MKKKRGKSKNFLICFWYLKGRSYRPYVVLEAISLESLKQSTKKADESKAKVEYSRNEVDESVKNVREYEKYLNKLKRALFKV